MQNFSLIDFSGQGEKSEKNAYMPNYAWHKHNLHWFSAPHLSKASYKISIEPLKIFRAKVAKVKKCINYA